MSSMRHKELLRMCFVWIEAIIATRDIDHRISLVSPIVSMGTSARTIMKESERHKMQAIEMASEDDDDDGHRRSKRSHDIVSSVIDRLPDTEF